MEIHTYLLTYLGSPLTRVSTSIVHNFTFILQIYYFHGLNPCPFNRKRATFLLHKYSPSNINSCMISIYIYMHELHTYGYSTFQLAGIMHCDLHGFGVFKNELINFIWTNVWDGPMATSGSKAQVINFAWTISLHRFERNFHQIYLSQLLSA